MKLGFSLILIFLCIASSTKGLRCYECVECIDIFDNGEIVECPPDYDNSCYFWNKNYDNGRRYVTRGCSSYSAPRCEWGEVSTYMFSLILHMYVNMKIHD